ncbi:MAG: hypothetical protein A2Z14_13190 [Chloroflexi bacterium RBG_16_48_8]|nr:MAG: hypothetical protein A2Z14_13190 [Chloroflexi bacterium RBG_16_48_8]
MGPVDHLVFSGDDQLLASARGSEVIQMWRLSDGALLGEIIALMVERLMFQPDNQNLLIGTGDGKVWRWEPPYTRPTLLLDNLGT